MTRMPKLLIMKSYQELGPRSSCHLPQKQQPAHSFHWHTEQMRSLCGRSILRFCRIWKRWPQRLPWWPARYWGCQWRHGSWGNGGLSYWSRCCLPSGSVWWLKSWKQRQTGCWFMSKIRILHFEPLLREMGQIITKLMVISNLENITKKLSMPTNNIKLPFKSTGTCCAIKRNSKYLLYGLKSTNFLF